MATGGKTEIGSNLLKIGTLTLKSGYLDPRGVFLVGDKLVITDDKSNKVRVYRCHDGMLMSSSDELESDPRGVCCVNDTDLCVAMRNGITLMSVSDSGLISRGTKFNLQTSFDYCTGVTSFRDNVVVSGVKDNTICWCVVSIQDGRHDNLHKVCGGRWTWMTTKENMVYLSCYAYENGVYGFNIMNPRQPPYTYKSKELLSPQGITVDDNGYLFLCDRYYDSIHHLTEKCELMAIYTEGIPHHPVAILWDSGILYVTAYESTVITMYETAYQGSAKTQMYRKDEKKKGYRLVEDVEKLTLEDKEGKQQKIGSTLFITTPAIQATGFSFDSAGSGTGFGTSGKLHRNVLNRCLSKLLEDLDFKTVSVYIQEKELFDPVTMRDILEQKTTTKKIKELIERIQLRDQDTYDKFKKCLVLAKQAFLKDMLEKEEALLLQNKRKT